MGPKRHGGGRLVLVALGTVGKARGLRGDVYVRAFHSASPLWTPGQVLTLVASPEPEHTWALEEAQVAVPPAWAREVVVARVGHGAKGRMSLGIEGVHTREAAEALRGALLGLRPEALPALEEGEFYLAELVGYAARGVDGAPLGTVTDVLALHQDLLEITPQGGGRPYLVPLVPALVPTIDRAGRSVTLDPPEGLAGAATAPEHEERR